MLQRGVSRIVDSSLAYRVQVADYTWSDVSFFRPAIGAPDYVGLVFDDAKSQARIAAVKLVRIADLGDARPLVLTLDYRPTRLTLLVDDDGVVVRAGWF